LLLTRSGGVSKPFDVNIRFIEVFDCIERLELLEEFNFQSPDKEGDKLALSHSLNVLEGWRLLDLTFSTSDKLCRLNDLLLGGGVMSLPSSVQTLLIEVFDPK